MKICNKCKIQKHKEDFHVDIQRIDGRSYRCKECTRPEKASVSKSYRKRNPAKRKNSQLLHEFGISLEEYNTILKNQNHSCAICARHQSEFKRNFDVDHNHKTGVVRGLLCNMCNQGIGLFKDSEERLLKALEYLRKNCADS